GALPEVMAVAAALSVPDPRERPEEEKEAAAAAHRAFSHPESDFLTLLNLWREAPDAEGGSRNALRRFCKANYLSLARMREWRDIYRQLADTMRERGGPALTTIPDRDPDYNAVHRSILTGLLGQVAQKQERNLYKASGNREVTLFPGSGLYERREREKKGSRNPKAPKPVDTSRQPLWIMAGEIVQTSQLFARSVAKIDPEWVVELGAHLCNFRYSEPAWSAKAGRVLVWERVLIHGLEIARRRVDYGKVNAVEATELFIRGALVAQDVHLPHRFFAENRKLREQIETTLTRVRSGRVHDIDEAFYRFYAARIEGVSSTHDLNQFIRTRSGKDPAFLCAKEEDILDASELAYERDMWPDQVAVGNSVLPISYAYSPGEEQDGVTVRVPLPIAERMTSGQLQWMVPGLREEQIATLLRALPKSLRKTLLPLEPKVKEVVREFQPGSEDFLAALAAFLTRKYRVQIQREDWPPESLPPHLRPRLEVVDRNQKTIVASRDLAAIQAKVEKQDVRGDAWTAATKRWEKYALSGWTIGDVPEAVTIEEVAGAAFVAYPGLAVREGDVDLRIFRKRAEAAQSSLGGIRLLAEKALERDVAWLRKELRSLARNALLYASLGSADQLQSAAYQNIVGHVFRMDPMLPLQEARFKAMLAAAKPALPGLAHRVGELTTQILESRQQLIMAQKRYPGMEQDVQRLVPADFLLRIPYDRLPHLARYMRAMQIRAERAWVSPAKDAEKAKQLAVFADWQKRVLPENQETFRWLLEEFRVSIFAQELGTAQPVSAKKLMALGDF
ncbi:MAG: DUF3418 domain-containing protein, partial [Chthoniobacteraceae bacterium]